MLREGLRLVGQQRPVVAQLGGGVKGRRLAAPATCCLRGQGCATRSTGLCAAWHGSGGTERLCTSKLTAAAPALGRKALKHCWGPLQHNPVARTWGSRCCAALRSTTASQDASRRSAENVGVEAAEEEGCASTTSEGDSLPEWLSLAPALPASASSRSGAAAGRVGAVARSREPSGLGAAEQRGRSDRTVGADWSCSSSDSSISTAWRWWEGLTRPCCGVLGPSIRGLRACSAGEWVGSAAAAPALALARAPSSSSGACRRGSGPC